MCKAKHIPSTVHHETKKDIIIGEKGITLVEYIGFFDIDTYSGPYTGEKYRFGLDRTKGYIDNRDLEGVLKITEDGQDVFRLWQS